MKVTKVSITVHQFHKSKGKGNKSLNIRIDYKNLPMILKLINQLHEFIFQLMWKNYDPDLSSLKR